MLTWLLDYQKETYLAFGEHISTFANGGGSAAFVAFLPMGLLLGAVHALMPGHSKLLMATYVVGSKEDLWSALLTAIVLAATHITISVLIVLLSLPVIDYMFGGSGPGSSPLLEHLSRGAIGGRNKSSPKSYAKVERNRNDAVDPMCNIRSLWIATDMRQF